MNIANGMRAKSALIMAVLGLAIAAQGTLHAFAEQPMMDTQEINTTSAVTSLCGFPLVVHEEGRLRTSLYFGGNGQVTRITENWQNVVSTLTNPDNGLSLSYRNAGRDGFTREADGSVTVFRQGVRWIITVPGAGAVSGEAGDLVVTLRDGSMEVQRSGFLREGGFEVVCSYLAGQTQEP